MPTGSADRHLVVALHGYAGTGAELAAVLAGCVPPAADVVVVAPDGPHRPALAPRGYAWFPITSEPVAIGRRARTVAPAVSRYVADARRRHRVVPERTCLVGFSQGVAVAAAVLADDPACGRAVLVCGRIPPDDRAAGSAPGSGTGPGPAPAVLVVAGGRDRFAPAGSVRRDLAGSHLRDRARLLVLPELGHEFTTETARLALAHATRQE